MAPTPEEHMAAIIANLETKTGHLNQAKWLKSEHGLGHVQAQTIASKAAQTDDYKPPDDQAELLRHHS